MGGGVPIQAGIRFGPNGSGKLYVSLYAHRGDRPQKSTWLREVPPPTEYDIFCWADTGDWRDDSGHYWGIRDGGRAALGCRGERLAKFPCCLNPSDPWHGYPVSPLEDGERAAPPGDFVERWRIAGIINRTIRRRILSRKI